MGIYSFYEGVRDLHDQNAGAISVLAGLCMVADGMLGNEYAETALGAYLVWNGLHTSRLQSKVDNLDSRLRNVEED